MEDNSTEKQHAATARRLADLRKKGIVLRSRDFSGGLVFLVIIFMILFMSGHIASQIQKNFILSFTGIKQLTLNPEFLSYLLKKMIIDNIMLIVPMFIGALAVGVISPFLFGGWNFSLNVVNFNFEKLNPFNNLKRLFSLKQSAMEMMRSMVKCALVLGVLFYFISTKKNEIIELINYPVNVSINLSYFLMKEFVILLSVTLILLVAFDIFYQYRQFQDQSKMSLQELKDEYKDSEGSSEVKRKIRSSQFSLHRQRLAVSVPHANVIITNPTHYAIALKYDNKKDRAPKVIAKGKDYLAQQIRYLAISNAIPIYEAPPLARAIYHTTKVNAEIHPELYMSVAIVLSYVHQLKNYQMGLGKQPNFVDDLEIPKEFIYDQ